MVGLGAHDFQLKLYFNAETGRLGRFLPRKQIRQHEVSLGNLLQGLGRYLLGRRRKQPVAIHSFLVDARVSLVITPPARRQFHICNDIDETGCNGPVPAGISAQDMAGENASQPS